MADEKMTRACEDAFRALERGDQQAAKQVLSEALSDAGRTPMVYAALDLVMKAGAVRQAMDGYEKAMHKCIQLILHSGEASEVERPRVTHVVRRSSLQATVLNALQKAGKPMNATELASITGLEQSRIYGVLSALGPGLKRVARGVYAVAENVEFEVLEDEGQEAAAAVSCATT